MDTLTLISRRVDLLLALPIEKLDRLIVEAQVQAIGQEDWEARLGGQGSAPYEQNTQQSPALGLSTAPHAGHS